jgi:hypothetical protein
MPTISQTLEWLSDLFKRADWEGRLSEELDWKNPLPGIEKGLNQFLGAPVRGNSST